MKLFYELPIDVLDILDRKYSETEALLLDGFTRETVRDDTQNLEVDVWEVMAENPHLSNRYELENSVFDFDGEESYADSIFMSYGGKDVSLYLVAPEYAADVADRLFGVFGIVYYMPTKDLLLTMLPRNRVQDIESIVREAI